MLILICGLPRAGKTTYSVRYNGIYPVLHLDERGYYNILKKVEALDDVVIEGIYDTKELRRELLRHYKGTEKKCVWLNTPTEVKKTRRGYVSALEYPFEPPTTEEGWNEVIMIE